MDRKTQFFLAKLAGVESKSNNFYESKNYTIHKDKDGWIDGDMLLKNIAMSKKIRSRYANG